MEPYVVVSDGKIFVKVQNFDSVCDIYDIKSRYDYYEYLKQ
jgi:hypothetical protein